MKRAILYFLLFDCLGTLAAAQGPIIFLTRHAERAEPAARPVAISAVDPGLSAATRLNDSDLSVAGRARAEALATALKDANITAIYATEYKRTQETAAPLAKSTGLRTTIVPAKETASLIAKLEEAQGNVLVVAHSNTIPEIIKGLGVTTRLTVTESDYDNLFLLIRANMPRLIHLHYQ